MNIATEKMVFSQHEMVLALDELKKIWLFERYNYYSLGEEQSKEMDEREVFYGIKLGTLRKIFT